MKDKLQVTAFLGTRRVATGALADVSLELQARLAESTSAPLVFDDGTGKVVEVDLRDGPQDLLRRLESRADLAESDADAPEPTTESRKPGRPKLGVVAREVTLLPRHWEWLSTQPGGASVALRKLVEQARRTHRETDGRRSAREAAYRFTSAMAGNEPGFEEATRALFAGDWAHFASCSQPWPEDVRSYALQLAEPSFSFSSAEPFTSR